MSVYEVIEEFLKTNKSGYDCLWNRDGECACDLSDLEPCGEMSLACEFGFRNNCEDCAKKDYCGIHLEHGWDWTGCNEICFVKPKTAESEG